MRTIARAAARAPEGKGALRGGGGVSDPGYSIGGCADGGSGGTRTLRHADEFVVRRAVAEPLIKRFEWDHHRRAVGQHLNGPSRSRSNQVSNSEVTSEFQRGWDAALLAVRRWHEAQASKTMIQARRSRFPKNLEREAEVHRKSAELIATLSPDDV